ncbi:MAG: chemotaxis protein CheW [Cyanobacteria bacterium P01_D01_bin.105]
MLLLRAGSERYGLGTKCIVEIIHRVELRQSHQVPSTVAGRFNYHGQMVPVIDLSQLLGGSASRPALGTRIILVKLAGSGERPQLLGLLAEQVTETLEAKQLTSVAESIKSTRHSYLEKHLLYQQESIQCLNIDKLFAEMIQQEGLFQPVRMADLDYKDTIVK